MQRLRKGATLMEHLSVPQIRRKSLNSWSAVQDTYFSIKDTFERHKVVFTIATSVGSVATAWVGYTLRHLHEAKVERRLDSIENAMKSNYQLEHAEFKKLVGSNSSGAAYAATAGASLIIGYGLGWRGGRWYANRKFRKEKMKLLEKIKPRRGALDILRRQFRRPNKSEGAIKASEAPQKNVPISSSSVEILPAC